MVGPIGIEDGNGAADSESVMEQDKKLIYINYLISRGLWKLIFYSVYFYTISELRVF